MNKKAWLILLCCVLLFTGCAGGYTIDEINEKYWETFQMTAKKEALHYKITYTIERGESDLVMESVLWRNGDDYYLENYQSGTVVSRNVRLDGQTYQHSALSDCWEPDDDANDIDPFEDILEAHASADHDGVLWGETDGVMTVLCSYPTFDDADDSEIASNTVTMYFDKQWDLQSFTIEPVLQEAYLRENGDEGLVTTKVEIYTTSIEDIQNAIRDAYQGGVDS